MTVEVGVRELRENLAGWLERAAAGEDILVTERGKPKARLTTAESAYERLVREGRLTPATGPRRRLPRAIEMKGSIVPFLDWSRGKGPWPGTGPEPGSPDDDDRPR
jgi:prevent-host-death family protein